MNTEEKDLQRSDRGRGKGKLYLVGIGPGGREDRTPRAERAIHESTVVVGYGLYLSLLADLTDGKRIVSSGMRKETDRCRQALEDADKGEIVSLVSSGDAGVYGMAGLAMEMAEALGYDIEMEVVPGITAAGAAAAKLGAPLMLDFACVSLSDLLVPWEEIQKKLDKVASADFVVAIYNPKSRKRVTQLEEAAQIFRRYRPGKTPVGICSAMGAEKEETVLTDLDHFLECPIDMRSIVIVGNASTVVIGSRMVTPRGYAL